MSENAIPVVTLNLAGKGAVKIELYPQIAPNTVNNFISLVKKGFYNGLTFHRVILGFMIQGGDPEGRGTGGPGYRIRGEFSCNGFENPLRHNRGVVSMARSADPDSAGSQFFIMVEDAPHLDGKYAAFGRVVEGMEHVDKVAAAEKDRNDKPLEDQIIESAVVDMAGYEFREPEIICE